MSGPWCRNDYDRPPEWYEREQAWFVAQDSMDVIYAYKKRHDDAGTDYCAAFKAHINQEDKDVERARRYFVLAVDIVLVQQECMNE